MIRRWLRSLRMGTEPVPRASTLEGLLDDVRPRWAERIARNPGVSPISTLALLVLDADVAAGGRAPVGSSRQVEEFARAWLTVLLDNDRLPPPMQLSAEELRRPRALLEAFFFSPSAVPHEAQALLRFVEGKFSAGQFSQVELLLQLFETDANTRRNNERNLFYEQMIARLMGRRQRPVAPDEAWNGLSADAALSPNEHLVQSTSWLAQHAGVRLHLLDRPATDVEAWAAAAAPLPPDLRAATLRVVPGWRWRPVHIVPANELTDIAYDHVVGVSVAEHTQRLISSAYFVVLATGATGHEPLIARTVQWMSSRFDTVGTRVLPELHRRCSVEEESLSAALRQVFDSMLAAGGTTLEPEPAAAQRAINRCSELFRELDPGSIPEGDYNLGGIMMDLLLGFEHERASEALRLHRIV